MEAHHNVFANGNLQSILREEMSAARPLFSDAHGAQGVVAGGLRVGSL
jgi:hypothetical protein